MWCGLLGSRPISHTWKRQLRYRHLQCLPPAWIFARMCLFYICGEYLGEPSPCNTLPSGLFWSSVILLVQPLSLYLSILKAYLFYLFSHSLCLSFLITYITSCIPCIFVILSHFTLLPVCFVQK